MTFLRQQDAPGVPLGLLALRRGIGARDAVHDPARRVSMEADERMPVALSRAAQQAHKDEIVRLREQVTTLERDLRRARRCLAAERAGREALRARLADEESAYAFGVGVLCALAFPGTNNEFVQSNECEGARARERRESRRVERVSRVCARSRAARG